MTTALVRRSESTSSVPKDVLVVGFATTGQAVAEALARFATHIVAVDDAPSVEALRKASALGVELIVAPSVDELRTLARAAELTVVSPGVPPTHPVFSVVRATAVISELELAFRLSSVPVVAVTGTNGKTTVTSLVTEMLVGSGINARAVGNIGTPLVAVSADEDLEVAVAEVSSFQLAFTSRFAPAVGTWLNFSPDHLDWHRDLKEYADAKALIWANQRPSDVAIANIDDRVVAEKLSEVTAQKITFGALDGDYRVEGSFLVGPDGEIAPLAALPRRLPHDQMNALAAVATARAAGASLSACREALSSWQIPPHRVEFIATVDGADYFDDSKATTPSAVIAALSGFASVVLIAGGRNKGLDLGDIASFIAERPDLLVRQIIAIGESSEELVGVFSPRWPVARAASMSEAVVRASVAALPGDAVLLSPGCASFDWYSSYAERGADFQRAVRSLKSSGAK